VVRNDFAHKRQQFSVSAVGNDGLLPIDLPPKHPPILFFVASRKVIRVIRGCFFVLYLNSNNFSLAPSATTVYSQ